MRTRASTWQYIDNTHRSMGGCSVAMVGEGGHVLKCRCDMESTLGVRTAGGEPRGVSTVSATASRCMCV